MSDTPDAAHRRVWKPLPPGMLDRYGLVLVAIVASLVVMGLVSNRPGGRTVIVVMFLAIFFLTLQTSGVPRRTTSRLAVVIPLALAMGAASDILGAQSPVSALSPLVSATLVIASLVFIARRLAKHVQVTRSTVFGALCIYLFGAMLFALVYILIALLSGQPFFAQTDDPSNLDYIYFSFITVATVGFGDLSPATDLGKMSAVVEAVSGQLYLLVVVALFVSNLGRQRGARLSDKEDAGD